MSGMNYSGVKFTRAKRNCHSLPNFQILNFLIGNFISKSSGQCQRQNNFSKIFLIHKRQQFTKKLTYCGALLAKVYFNFMEFLEYQINSLRKIKSCRITQQLLSLNQPLFYFSRPFSTANINQFYEIILFDFRVF